MKKRKSLKGMTLMEVIIALAIFAMLGVVLVQVGSLIDRTTRATVKLNRRVNAQSPYAASQTVNYMESNDEGVLESKDFAYDAMDINVSIDDMSGNPKTIKVQYKDYTYNEESGELIVDTIVVNEKDVKAQETISATRYNTRDLVMKNNNIHDTNLPNSNHDLKFAVIDEASKAEVILRESNDYKYRLTDSTGVPLMSYTFTSDDESLAKVSVDGTVIKGASAKAGDSVKVTATKENSPTYIWLVKFED